MNQAPSAGFATRWTRARIADVVEINPRRFDKPPSPDDVVSFVPMKAVEEETGRLDATTARPWAEVRKGYTPFQEGDVLFAKITPCMENGKYALATGLHGGRAAGSTEFHVLRPGPRIEAKFLLYYLFTPEVRQLAKARMKGTAGQLRVPEAVLADAVTPLPPIEEQRRVVEEIEQQLTRLQAGVAVLKRVQANLKRFRAAALKTACDGRLVPTEAELARREGRSYEPASILLSRIKADRANVAAAHRRGGQRETVATFPAALSPLPEGWAWTTVDQIAEVVRGASPRPAGDPRFFGGDIPWITVGPITADNDPFLRAVPATVTPAGRERSRYVEAGTLLLTNSGATLGVPKITLIGGCMNDGVAALLGLDYPLKLFLLYYLRSLTEPLRGINQGAAQPNLNTTIIKAIAVPLPPLAEQHRIVAEVERRLSLADELERVVSANLHRATRLRQAILAAAFTGRLSERYESSVREALELPHVAEEPRAYADKSPVSS